MRPQELGPHIRHWREVYVGNDQLPTYRGLILWHNANESIVVNGDAKRRAGAIPTTRPLHVLEIREVRVLNDPPWLIESNKAATMLIARGIVTRANEPED